MKRLSCFAHTLQLAIGDGLKHCDNVSDILKKIENLATALHSSTRMKEEFEANLNNKSIDNKSIAYFYS